MSLPDPKKAGRGTVGLKKIGTLENQGLHVRETGLEPASTYVHMNLNHARLPMLALTRQLLPAKPFSNSASDFSVVARMIP